MLRDSRGFPHIDSSGSMAAWRHLGHQRNMRHAREGALLFWLFQYHFRCIAVAVCFKQQ